MRSQWQNLLENLGIWDGSFTQLSPLGIVEKDTPTVVTFEGRDNNQTVYQTVQRFPPGETPPPILELEYKSLHRNLLFFDNGHFSQGSAHYNPVGTFGGEFGFIHEQRRLRFVILYQKGYLDRITLIREKLRDTTVPERPLLTIDQLLGTWEGEAIALYPDLRPPNYTRSTLSISREGNQITQTLKSGDISLNSTTTLDGSRLEFTGGSQPVQVLLLPDGGSTTTPIKVESGKPFFLEVGWLISPTERLRLIRSYDAQGAWQRLSLVRERKT
ncbi:MULTISPECIES: DUF3598 family protein [unclassified Roseofilum]|uniref:DUF3598 family protein n=1 Tax=unclassified Roseofilum TaxID=2620099 RepID=UPI001B119C78|nr:MULTISPECIES: DUF3598 family protein [unclassified Roseofilum]MBP0010746.1 DUF3598 family protein [Roseofilum sp. Belize Diploria]MBP0015515.1 DUF3598 family protein [Roseofilum sp. SID3]MBP0025562.1 DUF3598 family protein [Roseofilum sp. SID2]MBP0036597.1 DUF3598 family protein [Roseofilum sp. SID1]MBP0040528.1 DUF3598 family protein [Roseofilum sp. SBFL]